jgi:hypothetical protein
LCKLTLFKSPFPLSATLEILCDGDTNRQDIFDLYNRSLLSRIESDETYGEIQDPNYWLYNIDPAVRNYLEDTIAGTIKKSYSDLEREYGERKLS